jgi:hypothetical protein
MEKIVIINARENHWYHDQIGKVYLTDGIIKDVGGRRWWHLVNYDGKSKNLLIDVADAAYLRKVVEI